MQNYTYSIFSILAILIHLIINHDLLARRKAVAACGLRYRGFLHAVFAYYLSDAAWGVLAGLGWTRALYVDTIFFFLALPLFAFMWSLFVLDYLSLGRPARLVLRISGVALLAVNVILLAVNVFNGCIFYFAPDDTYLIGPLRYLLLVLLCVYYAVMSLFVLAKALRETDAVRRRSMMVFLFCIIVAASVILQVLWPLTPFTSLACLVGNCFLHVFVVQDEQAARHMAELEKALARVHAAEEARSRFFSIVSHDIRTPLNAILGYSEFLLGGTRSPEETSEALKAIRASGETLLLFIDDVLDLVTMKTGRLALRTEPVKISQLAGGALSAFSVTAAAKGLKLVDRTGDLPVLMLDGKRLQQVLFNLIANAIRFTDEGSVTIAASYNGGQLEVSVADTGSGIPPDEQKRILDPFARVQDASHSTYKDVGTGLGLSICRRLLEAMGGSLTVESELGKGSVFKASIPGVASAGNPAPAEPSAAGPQQECAAANLPERVLVVDDSPVNRKVLTALLKKAGVDSSGQASDGVEALAALDAAVKEGRPYDLVFSDYWMPRMNGVEFVEAIHADARFNDLRVYLVTADTEFCNNAKCSLFTGVILKPIEYSAIVNILHTVKRPPTACWDELMTVR